MSARDNYPDLARAAENGPGDERSALDEIDTLRTELTNTFTYENASLRTQRDRLRADLATANETAESFKRVALDHLTRLIAAELENDKLKALFIKTAIETGEY